MAAPKRGEVPAKISLEEGSDDWKKWRRLCQTDLYFLNAKVLQHEKIVPMTLRAHYGLCRFAERKTGIPEIDSSRVQLIHVARGWGKSVCVTKARTIQRLLLDQNWAAGIMNERQINANAFLSAIKSEFETNDLIRLLFPEIVPPNFRDVEWRADRITVQRTRANPVNPSVLAAGADATVTGVHMNEWLVDDILSEKAAENARTGSYSEIEQLNRRVIQLQPLLTRPKQDPLTFIGTPWWPGDTYDFIENLFGRGEKEREFLWHLQLPGGETQHISIIQKGELAIFKFKPIQEGRYIFPEYLNQDTMEALRQDDPAFFAAQFLLEPTAGGIAAFKPEYLNEFVWEKVGHQIRFRDQSGELKYELLRGMSIVMSVDPAISKRSTAARSAIVITASNGANIFLLEAWAQRCSVSDLAAKIISLFKQFQPQRIIIEAVGYQMALAEVLTLLSKEHATGKLPIYEHKTGNDLRKATRISGLEPYFRKGFFYWNPRSQSDFFEEYVNFSPDIGNRTVDLLDALSFQKESWEHLGFLGSSDRHAAELAAMQQQEQLKIGRIRERYSKGRRRTIRWDNRL